MLFATHYAISPSSFDDPGVELDAVDLRLEDRKFRFTIQTREHTDPYDDPFTDILIIGIGEEEPPEDVLLAFKEPERFKPPGPKSGDIEDIFRAPAPQFPQSYWDFLDRVVERLDVEANRLFGILRWRTGIRGGPPELRSSPRHLKWRQGD